VFSEEKPQRRATRRDARQRDFVNCLSTGTPVVTRSPRSVKTDPYEKPAHDGFAVFGPSEAVQGAAELTW